MVVLNKQKVIVLLSGGMDSVCALYYSAEKYEVVTALSFNYGSKHNHKELPYAAFHCKKLNIPHLVMNVDFIDKYFESNLLKSGEKIPKGQFSTENMKKTIVPFRNGIMLSIAAGFAECKGVEGIVIAAHSGEYSIYPDCREKFLKAMSAAVSSGSYTGIRIIRPFVFMTKDQIARKGRELGVDFSKTWSCYEGLDRHCGECGTCIERKGAFYSAGIADPTDYSAEVPLPPHPIN